MNYFTQRPLSGAQSTLSINLLNLSYLFQLKQNSFHFPFIQFYKTSITIWLFVFGLCFSLNSFSQKNIDEAIEKYNEHSVEYISTQQLVQLQKNNKNYSLVDTRLVEEYQVSHLKDAFHVGYKNFDIERVKKQFKKDETLIVYCSIGVRSEQIGEQLQNAGFTNVYNLYGGLFDWFNQGQPIYDSNNVKTNRIHPYDSFWGKFITKGQKVYE
ncbi:rhodanese-like domain-containing protein [Psychroflexus planctonicus]|nr:rhodanese-like domain-containing protein [Psychroflexus planctonicus]